MEKGMNCFFKLGVSGLLVLSLAGCLEVEDKSDKKVVAALEEQNRILEEQAQASSKAAQVTVTASGMVKDLSTPTSVSNASVTIKIGTSVTKSADVVNGSFSISDLPPNSDYELVVHSKSNQFLDRVFYGQTKNTTSPGISYQDLGSLSVSPGVERSFKVLDQETGESISTLIFVASSNLGQGFNSEAYWHKAQFDSASGQYKMTVPELIDVTILASLDVDNDGVLDYRFSNNSNSLSFSASLLNVQQNFLVDNLMSEDEDKKNIQVRVSVLDELSAPVSGLTLTVSDELNGVVKSTFDQTSKQYVLDLVIKNDLDVIVPSFVVLSKKYEATMVNVDYAGDNRYSIYSNYLYTSYLSFNSNESHVLNVVAKPPVSVAPIANLLTSGITPNPLNFELSMYFSSSITVAPNALELIKKDALNVVPGNASTEDIVLPGTTVIYTEQKIDITQQLSLGNTLLKASPVAPLIGGRYQYRLSQITNQSSGVIQSLNYQSSELTIVPAATEFLIADVKLDNNNYSAQQSAIKPQNTAGIPASFGGGYGSVSLYLPLSVSTLKNLTISKRSLVNNNVAEVEFATYSVVENGVVIPSAVATVSAAQNENIVIQPYNYSSIQFGTALNDANWYLFNVGEYLMDSTNSNVNSITFDYAFETMAGRVETGTITLQVL
jgi:hypothetical protein